MQLPLRTRRFGESFITRDAAGMSICAVYYENERGRQNATKRMDEETAREVTKRTAPLLTESGPTPANSMSAIACKAEADGVHGQVR